MRSRRDGATWYHPAGEPLFVLWEEVSPQSGAEAVALCIDGTCSTLDANATLMLNAGRHIVAKRVMSTVGQVRYSANVTVVVDETPPSRPEIVLSGDIDEAWWSDLSGTSGSWLPCADDESRVVGYVATLYQVGEREQRTPLASENV